MQAINEKTCEPLNGKEGLAVNRMVINDVYGTTKKRVKNREHFPMFGISLGNKFFVKGNRLTDNVMNYINWAVKNTRDRVAILIPDSIEAINIFYRGEKGTLESSEKLANRKGQAAQDQLMRIRDLMPIEEGELIDIRRWKEVGEGCERYDKNFSVTDREFLARKDFYKEVRSIVDRLVSVSPKKDSEANRDKLCYYFLREAAGLFGGFEYTKNGDTLYADLLMYPVISNVQKLIIDIQNGDKYYNITKDLDLKVQLSTISLNPSKK